MNNSVKVLVQELLFLASETIIQAPIIYLLCSKYTSHIDYAEAIYSIPGIFLLKGLIFLPFYLISRAAVGKGSIIHGGTYLLVSTTIAQIFPWNIFFCNWLNVGLCTVIAIISYYFNNKLIANKFIKN